ncbi:MAG: hypothetical protein ACYC35_05970 [Pirellulales bacterium]|jgi:hypothetical protein
MNINEIAETLDLRNLTPEIGRDEPVEVSGAYASDLLSDVLANAPGGGVLVTILAHMNVVAVAVHAGLAAVIFAGGIEPAEDVRQKAAEEGVFLYASAQVAFDVAGQLYALGLRGPVRRSPCRA